MDRLPDSFAAGLELMALRALGNAEDARDAVQETLARAVEAVRHQRVPTDVPLAAFVHGIAKHVITDVLRKRMRERGADPEVEQLTAPAPSPLELLIQREDRERVRGALARLPSRDRDLLSRCFVDGERIVDIARRSGEPAERVRKRKSRALERMRELLSGPRPGHVSSPTATVGA